MLIIPAASFHCRCRQAALLLLSAIVLVAGTSCSRQVKAKYEVSYRQSERSAVLVNGRAYPPQGAPSEVVRAIEAANRIQGLPYKWGGGHAVLDDNGFDCSGAASYVLRHAGLLNGQMPSRGFLNYGKRGEGDWITVYARKGHVFLVIAGLRFDTMGTHRQDGPRWRPESRRGKGHVLRHPPGL